MPLEKHEDEAMKLIMRACQMLGWVMAFTEPKWDTQDVKIDHLVIGERDVVQSMISESAEPYAIATPPKE